MFALNLKMWCAMTDRYALWECPPAIVEGFLQDMLRACAVALAQCLDEMPQESMLWVDFEELRAHPKQVLERAVRLLEPDSAVAREVMTRNLDQALGRIAIHDGSRTTLPDNETSEALEKLMA